MRCLRKSRVKSGMMRGRARRANRLHEGRHSHIWLIWPASRYSHIWLSFSRCRAAVIDKVLPAMKIRLLPATMLDALKSEALRFGALFVGILEAHEVAHVNQALADAAAHGVEELVGACRPARELCFQVGLFLRSVVRQA